MSERLQRAAKALSAHGLAVGLLALLLVAGLFAVRWISAQHDAPPPRKAMQFTMVKVAPPPPPPPPPKAPEPAPPTPQKELDEPQPQRMEIKAVDLPPPDAPPPSAPAAGPLAMAAEGTGPGDAFNLAGNPGGKGLLSGGGLGDGSGDGLGGSGSRQGWYYGRMRSAIEAVFRRQRVVVPASVKVDVRVWADAAGVIERIQLLRSTGDERVDAAVQSVVGTSISDPPPPDTPMPVILRLSFLRPG